HADIKRTTTAGLGRPMTSAAEEEQQRDDRKERAAETGESDAQREKQTGRARDGTVGVTHTAMCSHYEPQL
ncbi:MAG: hypothetical protein QG615_733, partial [Nitrospirota bacterium]|nr:hypothetical protein [Nitrospirota bacterium]